MATDLQNKLYRSDPKNIYLAELMAQQIYPRIINALNRLGIEEAKCEEVKGLKEFRITSNNKILFFSADNSFFAMDFSGEKSCPLFWTAPNSNVEKYDSPFLAYKLYCESIIKKLEELEEIILNANALIVKIENMGGVSLARKVLTEKLENNG